MKSMESYVNCPECGELVMVALKPYTDFMGGLANMIGEAIGVEKTVHFEGRNKCKCGKFIAASLHVTSMSKGGCNGNS
jgi:hypothetical protein